MKFKLFFTLALIAGSALPRVAAAQSGGSFNLARSTIDTGGGRSVGGQFLIVGTAGQLDAGKLSGGPYHIQGGFWTGLTLLQTPGAPILKIRLLGNGLVQLSWPLSVSDFTLQETTAPGNNIWEATLATVHDTALEHTVVVPALGVSKCYRLQK